MSNAVHCHHQKDFGLKMGSVVSHFNVSLLVLGKVTTDSVRKPQFVKRKVNRI